MANLSIDVSVNSVAAIRELRNLNTTLNSINTSASTINTTANTTFNNMDTQTKRVTGSVKLLNNAFGTFKGVFSGVLGALGVKKLFSGITNSLNGALENASTLYETCNVLEQTYKEQARLAYDWLETNSQVYGFSVTTATDYFSKYSALLQTMGVKNDEVLSDMSQNYTKLSGDIASFYNVTSESVYSAIVSGVTGTSIRPLEAFGLVLNETTLNAYMASKGIEQNFSSLSQLNKEYVRYAYILDSTRALQGDYARTSDSYANTIHTLQENWKNLLTTIGQYGTTLMQPVLHSLGTAIAYIDYFIKKLFELFGVEPTEYQFASDTANSFNLAANDAANITQDTKDTGKQLDKNNKKLKNGAKLLDLYEVDFGDPETGITANIELPDVDDSDLDLFDALKDSFWYSDEEFNPIKIDTTGLDKLLDIIAKAKENLEGFVNWVRYDLGFEEAFEHALANPADLVENVFAIAFGVTLLNRLWKKYGTTFFTLLASKIFRYGEGALWADVGRGILGGVIAGMAALIGGYNLGEVSTQLLSGAQVDIADATIGLVATIGSIIYMGVQTGPIGAAFEAILASITFVIGNIKEAEQQGTTLANNTLNMTSDMLSAYQPVLDGLFDAEAFSKSQSRLSELKDSFANTTNDLVNVQIPKLQEALYNADGQANLDVLSDLQQAYKDLAGAAAQYKTDSFKEEIQTSFDMFSAGAVQIGTATDSVTSYIQEYSKWHEEFVKSLSDEYAYLETQAVTGVLSEEQQARLTSLREYFGTEINEFDKYTQMLPSLDDIELFSPESIDKVKERIDSLKSMAETQYSQARDTAESDLNQALETGDAEALQNVSEYITTLEASYGGFVEEYNKIIERFNAQTKESATNLIATDIVNLTVQEGRLDSIIDAVLGGTPDTWNNYIRTYGDSIDWDLLPADFRARILKSAAEKQLSPDDVKQIGAALYGSFIDGINQGLSEYTITDSDFVSIDFEKWMSADSFYDTLESLGIPNRVRTTFDESIKTLVGSLANSDVFDAEYTTGRVLSITLDSVKPLVKPEDIDTSEARKIIEGQTKSSVSAALKGVSVETDAKDVGNSTAEGIKTGVEDNLGSQTTQEELTNAANIMVSGISSEADAKQKGSAFGNSIISGLASALNLAESDANLIDAKQNFIKILTDIPSRFADAFHTGLKSICTDIENFTTAAGSEIARVFTPNVTVTELATTLKTGGFKVPFLANGAVIPPNNPFLAVLGDQRSGYNIEAPLNVIQQAVASETKTPEVNVQNTVYIGNSELKDYIVDTVIDSNLTTG